MPSKRYVTITVKEELAPLVRRYYRELLSGAKKPLDFDRDYVILRMPREKFDKLSIFGELNQILIDYIYSCELILRCRPLQVMAWKGMVKNIPEVFGKIILDADKLFERQLDVREKLASYNIYSIPLTLLYEIAKIIGESENYRVSARYLAGSLGLSLETLLFILGSLERAGFVRIDIIGGRKLVDALIELTDSGRDITLLLLDISSQLNKKIEKAPTKEPWWLNASVDLIYWKRPCYYAVRIHVGPDDVWHYLTEEQKNILEKYVLRMINGTYFSREALEKLIETGIGIPHLDSILEEAGDLIVTYSEMDTTG
jgi:DNA-binding PadR family transcriptional regulator